ncbi:hypothetical protein F5Y13DRAFT_181745 [Hypoxylon sp. FL1857]|nr:hypothetical protein F5Y13DRAFT_181745 [Hypoxylon sp. FL1857]
MENSAGSDLQQVHLRVGPNGYEPVAHYTAKAILYMEENVEFQANILSLCPSHIWPKDSYRLACPRPILISKDHRQQLEELQEALAAAIADIVERWWTDNEAQFPKRMPLEKEEDDLLRWLEEQAPRDKVQKYSACRGSWRPDFLVEEHKRSDGVVAERFRITEINARFSFNGFMHAAYGQEALDNMGLGDSGLASATSATKFVDGLLNLFKPDLPLHLLKGEEPGIDIYMFIDAVQRHLGVTPRLISPSDLRLLPDPQSDGGYRLCCLAKDNGEVRFDSGNSTLTTPEGEIVEEIQQVGLELHQRELFALQPEILRQISLRCFNDMRTILLVHDKRMLGIVKQELQSLVTRGVLTAAQAHVLDDGVVDTILPGSQELEQLFQMFKSSEELKDGYIIKPIRSGKGAGIVFGEDKGTDEWISALEPLQSPGLDLRTTCVVQRRIVPRLYDVILNTSGERSRYALCGTYHVINGEFLGLGIWRASGNRICAVSHGSSWICSVARED